MSLINQMLRDLEQRNQATAKTGTPQPLDIALMRQPSPSGRRAMLWLLVLVALVGWLAWNWFSKPDSAPDVSTVSFEAPAQAIVAEPKPQPAQSASIPEQQTTAIVEAAQPQSAATPISEIIPAPQPTQPLPSEESQPPTTTEPTAKARVSTALKTDHSATRSPIDSAESLFRHAENNASNIMRKEVLREVLQLNSHHLPARQKLLGILVQEHSTLELKRFLDESLALFPNHLGFITTLAHYYVQQKDFTAAIATLERVDNFTISDSHYLELLAASYQQQQLFGKALPLYQKLSQLQPEKAEHWLGLGICADKLQQPHSALQAYQHALNKNTLGSDVVDYIKQRLSALTR